MGTIAHWMRRFNHALEASSQVLTLLSPESVEQRCREAGHHCRRSFWSPANTLTAWLLQTLSESKTLRQGVMEMIDLQVTRRAIDRSRRPSSDPSAFCAARKRLPARVIEATLRETISRIEQLAGESVLWLGRRVWIVDGSSATMPDAPELQAAFPQPSEQKPGCGFPVMSLLVVFCWATGTVIDLAMGSLRDSERQQFRRLMGRFGPGDLVLADRGFCSYVDIARLLMQGADVAFRLHACKRNFRQIKCFGRNDCLITWERPRWIRTFGLTREDYERLPEQLTLRMVWTRCTGRGQRSREIVLVTTILDPKEASAGELLGLYRDRWLAEMNLKSLKITLGMDILRGKSVDVVRKEVLMHVLLYNVIRLMMWEAAQARGKNARRLSFAAALDQLQIEARHLLGGGKWVGEKLLRLLELLREITRHVVPSRPGRTEPRRLKRRQKHFSKMVESRAHYRRTGDPHAD